MWYCKYSILSREDVENKIGQLNKSVNKGDQFKWDNVNNVGHLDMILRIKVAIQRCWK